MLLLPRALAGLLAVLLAAPACAADWPLWRHDARRSAASPQSLPARMHLQWVRQLPELKPAWPDQAKMQLDTLYRPVVLGHRLFVSSSHDDTVTAYDTASGKELWRFPAGGPVRYAPAAWQDRLFFACDDGFLYCLDAARGSLLWKFRGGPTDRLVLGNDRLISTWPARGAPVVQDGVVYFAAGIWPFMGIFLHALDARTGKVVWTNDGDGCVYIKQPHNADSFAGVAPQGPLAVTGDRLLVPGGRSVPACFDRKTGKLLYYQLAENGKKGGGSTVSATDKLIFNGGAVFDLANEKMLGVSGPHVVHTDTVLFVGEDDGCHAFDLTSSGVTEVEMLDRKGNKVKTTRWKLKDLGAIETIELTALIKAGGRLYAGGVDELVAIDVPLRTKKDQVPVSWRAEVDGVVGELLAADDRLFAVTDEGRLYCFGADEVEPRVYQQPSRVEPVRDAWTTRARHLIEAAGVRDGYAVVWGVGSGRLVEELARQSNLRLIVVEPDEKKALAFRERLRQQGVECQRVSVVIAEPDEIQLPPYLASLMATEAFPAPELGMDAEVVAKMFASLRPFGGVACLPVPAERREELGRLVDGLRLDNDRLRWVNGFTLLSREGPLPGSANWTHEHADAANTRVSRDRLVKAPLGVLWFGGPSHDGVLPRHGHGPQPQVIDGRLLIEGIDMLRCTDIYTGRLLWEARLPGVGSFYNNLAHQPGANSSGTNFISTADGVYVAYRKACLRLDPATGKTLSEFRLPVLPGEKEPPTWGYLNVAGDYLVAGAEPLFDPKLGRESKPVPKSDDDPVTKLTTKLTRGANDNLSSSRQLAVLDRHTGKVLWTVVAEHGFRHNGICVGGGRLYAIDRLSGPQLSRLKRRGETPKSPSRLFAFDLKTGTELWKTDGDVFGTWLSYSAERDVLVEAGRVARDTINDEPVGMRAYRAANGTVLWHEPKHSGPAMIKGDTVLMAGNACDLLTGRLKLRADPLTGEPAEWIWLRNYGCNTPAASEHLLTFRSGAAGFYDLAGDGGTANLGGFRSSCTNNLIVAGGVLSAPDYTRTCICNYQNQTSLGFVHTPEAEVWTFFSGKATRGPVRRVGINFGAPGDRRAEDGTLWLEYPSVGGKSPVVPVQMFPDKSTYIRRHSSRVKGEGPGWVASSAAKGLTGFAVDLSGGAKCGERRFTVRLHFAELEDRGPGERVFDVAIQGETVLHRFDIAKAAGGTFRSVVKEFKGVTVTKNLVVTFAPADEGRASLSLVGGVEIIEEGK